MVLRQVMSCSLPRALLRRVLHRTTTTGASAPLSRTPTIRSQPLWSCALSRPRSPVNPTVGFSRYQSNLPHSHSGPSPSTYCTSSTSDVPGTGKATDRKLAIVFTCTVCETRSAKTFTELAYTKGVVLVRCPGCENLHLIADNLGWFEDGNRNVEDILRDHGQEITKITDDTISIDPQALVGQEGDPKIES